MAIKKTVRTTETRGREILVTFDVEYEGGTTDAFGGYVQRAEAEGKSEKAVEKLAWEEAEPRVLARQAELERVASQNPTPPKRESAPEPTTETTPASPAAAPDGPPAGRRTREMNPKAAREPRPRTRELNPKAVREEANQGKRESPAAPHAFAQPDAFPPAPTDRDG